ncbi:DUF3987 domain-containing protein [Neobacillus sp. 3P2-tot-E-2]|uniref:DUF3987 domain-containing protein n=1 Tax=Neobacillus sp. 3P2-tot-E-2 TaxID=3132212 RepID=UPI0039A3DE7B
MEVNPIKILKQLELVELFKGIPLKFIRLVGYADQNMDYKRAKAPIDRDFTQESYMNPSREALGEWIEQGGWLGMIVPDNHILIDIDDKQIGDYMYQQLMKDKASFHAIQTPNGYQFIFKDNRKVTRQTVKTLTEIGIEVDYRLENKGYFVVPTKGTENRRWLYCCNDPLDDMPFMFNPIKDKPKERDMIPIPIIEGSRNQTLFEHACRLLYYGKKADELKQILMYMNKHLLNMPLKAAEIENIFNSALKYHKRDSQEGILQPFEINGDEHTPKPLPITKVKAFPLEIFPTSVKGLFTVASKAISCPIDYIAVPFLSIVGTIIGNTHVAEIKAGYKKKAILWTCSIGSSGYAKSPAKDVALKPLQKIQEQLHEEYEQAIEEYELNSEEGKTSKPVVKRAFTSDATLEAVIELNKDNPRGILFESDELAGWLNGMNQYKGGKGNDRQRWLKLWNGTAVTSDRKSEKLYLPNPLINVTGTAQPDVIKSILNNYISDGLIERILFCYPNSFPPYWSEQEIPPQLEEIYEETLFKLYQIKLTEEPIVVLFIGGAREIYEKWHNETVEESEDAKFTELLKGHWAKLRGYCISFALIIHLLRLADGEKESEKITEMDIQGAIRLANYFKSHFLKLVSFANSDIETQRVMNVLGKIKQEGGTITTRTVYSNGWCGIRSAEDAKQLFELIESYGWGNITVQKNSHGKDSVLITLTDDVLSQIS